MQDDHDDLRTDLPSPRLVRMRSGSMMQLLQQYPAVVPTTGKEEVALCLATSQNI
jgi:hypothetical protein